MTRSFRLAILALLLAVALTAAALPWLLPPLSAATPAPHWRDDGLLVRGAYHVHSTASDGTGAADAIAAAAAKAGLRFVILTDHGDGTEPYEPPRYRSGVLCIHGVELNTRGGHVVALGARRSPYPLAGAAESVLEDVHRLGGIAIAAHPDSPRASLRWTDWTVPVDGLEWLNTDSEWRDEFLASLGRLMLTYALRPAETLTAALDRPAQSLATWDRLTATRRVVGVAGADAHARLGFRAQAEPFDEGWHVPLPSYQASFAAFGLRVQLDAPLSGEADRDARDIIELLQKGRVFTVVDGLAGPGAFDFSATSAGRSARMGDYLEIGGEVVLHARMAAPPGARMVILQNGRELFDTRDREAHLGVAPEPAVYRVEINVPAARGPQPIPWLVSNPIYVGMRARHARPDVPVPAATQRTAVSTDLWVSESSGQSSSQLTTGIPGEGDMPLEWRYRLAPGDPAGQYAALRFPASGLVGLDRLQLRARSDQPMRVWVQLRASDAGAGERWGRSVYLDEQVRSVEVLFSEMTPLGVTSGAAPPLDKVDAMLLVVDTVNARPGTTGRVRLSELWLARP